MAIHKAGRRLFRAIGIDKIRKNLTNRGGRSVIASLNLTAMVDMMTVLVTFLMMLFNAEGDILAADKNIKLPDARNHKELEKAVLIQISPVALKFEGETILGDTNPEEMNQLASKDQAASLLAAAPLLAKLEEKAKELEKIKERKADKKDEPNEVIIQADSGVKYSTITRVMKACADKGFLKINLAVQAVAGE